VVLNGVWILGDLEMREYVYNSIIELELNYDSINIIKIIINQVKDAEYKKNDN
jgi:hypothetical protein